MVSLWEECGMSHLRADDLQRGLMMITLKRDDDVILLHLCELMMKDAITEDHHLQDEGAELEVAHVHRHLHQIGSQVQDPKSAQVDMADTNASYNGLIDM